MDSIIRLGAAAVFLFLLLASPARALDDPASFTLDLPLAGNAPRPSWLGQPQVPMTTFAALDLPIQPPDARSSLLVTVFFQEKAGGFLRIAWQGGQESQTFSDNFYEGIGMGNQRSLLITPEAMQGAGTLVFQCGDTALGIQRIRLQWLENQNGLVGKDVQDTLVTPSLGQTQPAQLLNGQPQPVEDPAWQGRLVVVPLTDTPQRIEQGVEFSVQLDGAPTSARLALEENGLPMGKHLAVWVNQQRAGTITPAAPDLRDDGFLGAAASSGVYVGWREGSMLVPVSFLKAGVDTIQFAVEDDLTTTTVTATGAAALPLAVKNVVLQLGYPASGDVPVAPAAAPASSAPPASATDPTGPITPDLSVPGSYSVTTFSTNAP